MTKQEKQIDEIQRHNALIAMVERIERVAAEVKPPPYVNSRLTRGGARKELEAIAADFRALLASEAAP